MNRAEAGPIRRFGDRCLRQVCRPVRPEAPQTAALLDRLWASLLADDGVGLAAPQIGETQRVLIVRDPATADDRRDERRLELVNPRLEETFGPRTSFEEGCLSFPGLYLKIRRPQGIVVTYHDREGRPRRLRDQGLVARIIQHEIDHLDGRLFIDHLPALGRLAIAPRLGWIRAAGSWRQGRDQA